MAPSAVLVMVAVLAAPRSRISPGSGGILRRIMKCWPAIAGGPQAWSERLGLSRAAGSRSASLNHPPQPGADMSPIMHLAEVLAHLVEREQTIDATEQESEIFSGRTLRNREANLSALQGVEQALAALSAEGMPEAAIQVMVAAGLAKQLADELDETPEAREIVQRIDALLSSALPALGRAGEVDLARFRPARYGLAAPPGPTDGPPEGPPA